MESYDRILDRFCVPQETIDGGLQQYAIRPGSQAAMVAALEVGASFLWDTPFMNPWTGAGAFIRYVIEHPEQFAGKALVDVGAGSGLLAIAAARAGAEVTAVDSDPLAAAVIARNAALNGVEIKVIAADFMAAAKEIAAADMTVACDMLFYDNGRDKAGWFDRITGARQLAMISCDFDLLTCDLPGLHVTSTPGHKVHDFSFASMAFKNMPHAVAFFSEGVEAVRSRGFARPAGARPLACRAGD